MDIIIKPSGRDDGNSSIYVKRSGTVEIYFGSVTSPDIYGLCWISVSYVSDTEAMNITVADRADGVQDTVRRMARLQLGWSK